MDKILNQVIEFTRQAAQIMLKGMAEVHEKGDASNLVTDKDLKVQEFLQLKLKPLIADAVFVGEESDGECLNARRKWIIDPIDGTSNFVRGMNLSAISVGLIEDGKSVLGVIYLPYTDEMFYATFGGGAFLNGKKIHVSDRDFAHSCFCTAFSLYDKRFAPQCQKILNDVYSECDDFRRLGSAAIELCYLAAGRAELYFEIRIFHWDFAASEIIIKEAGGYLEKLFSPYYDYDRPIPLIAANSKTNFLKLKDKVTKHLNSVPYEK